MLQFFVEKYFYFLVAEIDASLHNFGFIQRSNASIHGTQTCLITLSWKISTLIFVKYLFIPYITCSVLCKKKKKVAHTTKTKLSKVYFLFSTESKI